MRKKFENYTDLLSRLYPNEHLFNGALSRTVTFQVTESCNLSCSYCYQICKNTSVMKLEDAKLLIDMLLNDDPKLQHYITPYNSPGIIIDFIGGEPFLQIELIEQICDYFVEQAIEKCHPWATKFIFSITSNGVLYFDEKVQHFLNKYKDLVSLSITLDGNEQLHDACRRFPDGSPSYKLAEAACKDWMSRSNELGSKITLAPSNIAYMYDAILNMIDLGYKEIMINGVYEEGWTYEHAAIAYEQSKKVADYLLQNNLEDDIYISWFEEAVGYPMDEQDNKNWCGGTNSMLAMDPAGNLFPCLRYMRTSLGNDAEPYIIGNVHEGLCSTEIEINRMKCMDCITRRSQSTDECFNCPIAQGCGWCSAYNYQIYGTPDKRCTYICPLHQARSCALNYYVNKYNIKHDNGDKLKLYCPKDWALRFMDENEYNKLLSLSIEEE